jgi:alkylated DNA repair dioxygenase AlkB
VVTHYPCFFAPDVADELFQAVLATTPWEQHEVIMFGERHAVPRLESWHGDPEAHYAYSGIDLVPVPWTPPLRQVRDGIAPAMGGPANGVLCNLYRDGADKVGWHADDEPELGDQPVIGSVSFGATRRFRLRPAGGGTVTALDLEHGSLLVMAGATQHRFVHELAKTGKSVGRRVNLTYRRVHTTAIDG